MQTCKLVHTPDLSFYEPFKFKVAFFFYQNWKCLSCYRSDFIIPICNSTVLFHFTVALGDVFHLPINVLCLISCTYFSSSEMHSTSFYQKSGLLYFFRLFKCLSLSLFYLRWNLNIFGFDEAVLYIFCCGRGLGRSLFSLVTRITSIPAKFLMSSKPMLFFVPFMGT